MRVYFVLVCCLCFSKGVFGWGFYGHRLINRMAVFTLPAPLAGFYKSNITYISNHAVDPDKRRYVLTEEAPRHYIDLDHFSESEYEKLALPRDSAAFYFSEDTLLAYGTVHWNIALQYRKLVYAFQAYDLKKVLKISADLGHYVGDVHVPLHTTSNYNGQKTNQEGIHGLWESRVPELFAHGYVHWVGAAAYEANPLHRAWQAVLSSHAALDSVFAAEIEATRLVGASAKYAIENRGGRDMKVYSSEYSKKYHDLLAGQQERRMNMAIKMTGDLWYSAWMDAGAPDLPGINNDDEGYETELPEVNEKRLKVRPHE